MRTQVMPDRSTATPWLEYDTGESGPPQRILLEHFPFTIGRSETADFQVNSGRVSREHAAILQEGRAYRLQDLQSTNGTFLNGRRVDEVPLGDGDLVVLADVELTFRSGQQQEAARGTLVMGAAPRESETEQASAILRSVRRMQETLLARAVATVFQPIVALEDGSVAGYVAVHEGSGIDLYRPEEDGRLLSRDCRLTSRVRQLRRLLAAEEAARLPDGSLLVVSLDASEIGARALPDSLGEVRGRLGGGWRLAVEIPDSAVSDNPYAQQLQRDLEARDIALACGPFSGSMQHLEQAAVRPDYLRLAPASIRGIDRRPDRQRWLNAAAETARGWGADLIAEGIQTKSEAATCLTLGCRLGQGQGLDRKSVPAMN